MHLTFCELRRKSASETVSSPRISHTSCFKTQVSPSLSIELIKRNVRQGFLILPPTLACSQNKLKQNIKLKFREPSWLQYCSPSFAEVVHASQTPLRSHRGPSNPPVLLLRPPVPCQLWPGVHRFGGKVPLVALDCCLLSCLGAAGVCGWNGLWAECAQPEVQGVRG